MISTQAYVVGGSYSMTSMTASALRPWRSKWMRWRSPLPLLVGPGTVETQLGSHSGMRLASEMRSNTYWMVTPTVPVYVSDTGRMGIKICASCAVRGTRLPPMRDYPQPRTARPPAVTAHRAPRTNRSVGRRAALDLRGLLSQG